ncbi:FecCD family ABC transporter permease [Pseudalkalibacillus salsuginis]|uniref:FecCD family ABC transporter permease n=1 Tax=Pseudalkalibacillus salsuginis TaxID=2910972 RepID=UPI001F195E89|nr:iron ABC transporter permease [Pseudalkalibacillus salsuginis]MCF6410755.1 iron ABC transporter permease [Pseudalkalibacillus salsuginis]
MVNKRIYKSIYVGTPLFLLIIYIFILSLQLGEPRLDLVTLGQVLTNQFELEIHRISVWEIRMPRSIMAIMAGVMLALAGHVLQETFQNDLATPELISVTAGSSFVMAFITVFGLPVLFIVQPFLALTGGLIAGGFVIGSAKNSFKRGSIILLGTAVSAFLNALIIIIIALGKENQIGLLFFYLAGSLSARNWSHVFNLLPWFIIFVPLALGSARSLNVLRLGDEAAVGRGASVIKMKILLLVISAGLTAVVVANCGPIGFISLITPHLTKRLLRTTNSALGLPITALLGGFLLLTGDLLMRTLLYPIELPVGLLTTIIGGSLFLTLLYRRSVRT